MLAPQAENTFVQPIADERVIAIDGDPADVAAARESIRLAFVAALQHLPARQRAVLILCEVLKWQATEVAELLETSVASVNSALQRARATLGSLPIDELDSTVDPEHEALLARYVDAFERYDMTALAALLRDDVVISMPPHDLWLQGPDDVVGWMVGPGHACAGSKLLPVWANGTAGFGSYKPARPRPLGAVGPAGHRGPRRPAVGPPQLPLPGALRRVRAAALPRGLSGHLSRISVGAHELHQLEQVRPHVDEADRPPEPARRELDAQQVLHEAEVARSAGRRRGRGRRSSPSRRSTTTAVGRTSPGSIDASDDAVGGNSPWPHRRHPRFTRPR